MIDLFPAPAVIVNAAGKIVAANKAVRKYTGYSPEDLVGKNLFEQGFFEDQTNMLLQLKMKKRLKGSYIPVSETRVKAKNGDLRFLEIKGNKIEYEGQICDLIIFYDVTERSNQRKRLQQELFESEEKSLGITNSIKDAIILVDNETKVIYWNPAAEKTFGYTIEEATGKYVHELVIPKTMCKEAKER
ncbi:MAG TPA: PAS domain-containing protein, partial [Candidatus Bathyarchaeia archaeon]|nr:PAS domain-containing protein [Candidatus Bathyarchaeia archaeon]